MMIAHLTDIHIGREGETPRGVPVRENFIGILDEIAENGPDLLVLTGDVALDTGEGEVYRWVYSVLESSGLNYQVLPGNHDDPTMVTECFGVRAGAAFRKGGAAHRRLSIKNEEILLLDMPKGIASEADLRGIRKELGDSRGSELLVFMHYPPVPMPVAHMEERYTLQGREMVAEAFLSSGKRIHVFCGHYHAELTQEAEALSVHITPSTYYQIHRLREAFTIEHQRPAWRFISRYEGRITTGVRYREH